MLAQTFAMHVSHASQPPLVWQPVADHQVADCGPPPPRAASVAMTGGYDVEAVLAIGELAAAQPDAADDDRTRSA